MLFLKIAKKTLLFFAIFFIMEPEVNLLFLKITKPRRLK
jgi:hypothetical protein